MPTHPTQLLTETTSPGSLQLQFAYNLRDFDHAKKQMRKLNTVDHIFYMGSRIIIWTLLTPILLALIASILLYPVRLMASPSSISKQDLVRLAIAFFTALFVAIGIFVRRHLRRRKDQKIQRIMHVISLTPQGLIWTSGDTRIQRAWSAYRRFFETRDLLLLRDRTHTMILPKRIMTSDQLITTRDILNAHLRRTQAFPVLVGNSTGQQPMPVPQ